MASNQSNISLGERKDKKDVEERPVFAPKFDSDGLIPAIAMDATTKEPLMLAYMNEESLLKNSRNRGSGLLLEEQAGNLA